MESQRVGNDLATKQQAFFAAQRCPHPPRPCSPCWLSCLWTCTRPLQPRHRQLPWMWRGIVGVVFPHGVAHMHPNFVCFFFFYFCASPGHPRLHHHTTHRDIDAHTPHTYKHTTPTSYHMHHTDIRTPHRQHRHTQTHTHTYTHDTAREAMLLPRGTSPHSRLVN